MAIRYCGNAAVYIQYVGCVCGRDEYKGYVRVDRLIWKFSGLFAPACGFDFAYDSPQAYDEMAQSAIGFGAYYTTHNRSYGGYNGYPSAEVADAIDEATSWAMDEQGTYNVRRRA